MQYKYSGFTLLELLCTVAIMGVLISISVPFAKKVILNQKNKSSLQRLTTALNFAREQAIVHNRIVTVCPSINRRDCINDWQQTLLIFADDAIKGKLEAGDKLLRVVQKKEWGHLSLRAFPTSRYFRFHPNGFTDNQNGTFRYCSGGAGWSVVINRAGRLRGEIIEKC